MGNAGLAIGLGAVIGILLLVLLALLIYFVVLRTRKGNHGASDTYYSEEDYEQPTNNNKPTTNGHIPTPENGSIRSQPPDIIEAHEMTPISNGFAHPVSTDTIDIADEAKTTPNDKGDKPMPVQTVIGMPEVKQHEPIPDAIPPPAPKVVPTPEPDVVRETSPKPSPKLKRGSVFKYIETLERTAAKSKNDITPKYPAVVPVPKIPEAREPSGTSGNYAEPETIEPIYVEAVVEPVPKERQDNTASDTYAVPSKPKNPDKPKGDRNASKKNRRVTFADDPIEMEPEIPPKMEDL